MKTLPAVTRRTQKTTSNDGAIRQHTAEFGYVVLLSNDIKTAICEPGKSDCRHRYPGEQPGRVWINSEQYFDGKLPALRLFKHLF